MPNLAKTHAGSLAVCPRFLRGSIGLQVFSAFSLSIVLSLSPGQTRADTLYVWSGSPANGPGTHWTNAFHEIQSAVDAAVPNDKVVVTNGLYATGGKITPGGYLMNRVAVTQAITVESVNGPDVTTIEGQGPLGLGAVRCAYLSGGAVLTGFTLTNGYTAASDASSLEDCGGGAWADGGRLVNCLLTCNTASDLGGGTFRGVLSECALTRNVAANGGGAFVATLSNCLVFTNRTTLFVGGSGTTGGLLINCTVAYNRGQGGGSAGVGSSPVPPPVLTNCIVYYNTPRNFTVARMNHSCSTPQPTGIDNTSSAPEFVSSLNLRLLPASPCINTGINSAVTGNRDLGADPRIQAGVVDMGAYESPYAFITASAGSGGTIDPAGRVPVLVSSNQTFSIRPDSAGMAVVDVAVDGRSIGTTLDYTFPSVSREHTIHASFLAKPDAPDPVFVRVGGDQESGFAMHWYAAEGWAYRLQRTPSLNPTAWSEMTLYSNMTAIHPDLFCVTNAPITLGPQMFFRLIATPQE